MSVIQSTVTGWIGRSGSWGGGIRRGVLVLVGRACDDAVINKGVTKGTGEAIETTRFSFLFGAII